MVLQELGQKLKDALNKLNKSDNIDQKLLKEMLTTLSIALIKSDVNLHLVKKLTTKKRSVTIKKLKSKKKYYVKVRAYTNGKSGKVYGAWSKVKIIKVK